MHIKKSLGVFVLLFLLLSSSGIVLADDQCRDATIQTANKSLSEDIQYIARKLAENNDGRVVVKDKMIVATIGRTVMPIIVAEQKSQKTTDLIPAAQRVMRMQIAKVRAILGIHNRGPEPLDTPNGKQTAKLILQQLADEMRELPDYATVSPDPRSMFRKMADNYMASRSKVVGVTAAIIPFVGYFSGLLLGRLIDPNVAHSYHMSHAVWLASIFTSPIYFLTAFTELTAKSTHLVLNYHSKTVESPTELLLRYVVHFKAESLLMERHKNLYYYDKYYPYDEDPLTVRRAPNPKEWKEIVKLAIHEVSMSIENDQFEGIQSHSKTRSLSLVSKQLDRMVNSAMLDERTLNALQDFENFVNNSLARKRRAEDPFIVSSDVIKELEEIYKIDEDEAYKRLVEMMKLAYPEVAFSLVSADKFKSEIQEKNALADALLSATEKFPVVDRAILYGVLNNGGIQVDDYRRDYASQAALEIAAIFSIGREYAATVLAKLNAVASPGTIKIMRRANPPREVMGFMFEDSKGFINAHFIPQALDQDGVRAVIIGYLSTLAVKEKLNVNPSPLQAEAFDRLNTHLRNTSLNPPEGSEDLNALEQISAAYLEN